MRYIKRLLEKEIKKAVRNFPAVILTGPRRAGKTTLLQKTFPKSSYYLLEDPDIIGRIKYDPRSFIDKIKLPVILDEIQNVPELFNYIRTKIDYNPEKNGNWLITGSQESNLMQGVTESMAGRTAVFNLLPFSLEEHEKVSILKGGFPEAIIKSKVSDIWFRSYIQTYLERDVRLITSIRDLSLFRRFLTILAIRNGQMLNRTDIAAPLGVSVSTISEWLNILLITSQIILVPPFYENFGKRLIKSPKLYFTDTGLLCYLLNIESNDMLQKSPFFGSIFEGFIASEILKYQYNHGKRRNIYYFRDRTGLEIDFIIPTEDMKLNLVEVKASRTIKPEMLVNLNRLSKANFKYKTKKCLVHLPVKDKVDIQDKLKGVEILSYNKIKNIF